VRVKKLSAFILFGLVLLLGGCAPGTETTVGPEASPTATLSPTPVTTATMDPTGTTATPMGLASITGNLDNYVGKTVTVTADVEEVVGPKAFKLDEDNALAGGIDNDVLVISPKAASLANIDDQWLNNKVRVTGKVMKLAVTEIEREVSWDLDPQIEAELNEVKAVIVASAVERVNK
jgi:hypothetical protein